MSLLRRLSISTLLSLALCPLATAHHPSDFDSQLEVIAFGSCNRQFLPQPLWPVIAENQPDLWIWGGDNIYGDSKDASVIEAKYQEQLSNPNYAAFRKQFPIVGTWDDHDYGWNDAHSGRLAKRRTRLFLGELRLALLGRLLALLFIVILL